jgi:hypothetical protein
VSTRWDATAKGFSGACAPSGGANLAVWDRWHWLNVASSALASPAPMRWSTSDPIAISRLFYGNPRALNFAAIPAVSNGCGIGSVGTDYVEVEVIYRLP